MSALETFRKSPVDVIDYDFDYSLWLSKRGNDTISSYRMVVPTDLIVDQVVQIQTTIKAFIRGGVIGKNYDVSCIIETAGGRTKQATIRLVIG